MLALADICRSAAAACPAFSDAAAMLRVWARQQQLSQGADGLGSALLTLVLVHLLETGQAVSAACGSRACWLVGGCMAAAAARARRRRGARTTAECAKRCSDPP